MRVLVNSDSSVNVPAEIATQIVATVEGALRLFASDITRIEVHLADVNASKGGGGDKRCVLESRVAGLQPIAVHHHAGTQDEALDGALLKLQRALQTALGRVRAH